MTATDELTNIGIDAIIKKAVILSRDPEWPPWRAYEVAKRTIADFNLPADEYEAAIKSLAEALKI